MPRGSSDTSPRGPALGPLTRRRRPCLARRTAVFLSKRRLCRRGRVRGMGGDRRTRERSSHTRTSSPFPPATPYRARAAGRLAEQPGQSQVAWAERRPAGACSRRRWRGAPLFQPPRPRHGSKNRRRRSGAHTISALLRGYAAPLGPTSRSRGADQAVVRLPFLADWNETLQPPLERPCEVPRRPDDGPRRGPRFWTAARVERGGGHEALEAERAGDRVAPR